MHKNSDKKEPTLLSDLFTFSLLGDGQVRQAVGAACYVEWLCGAVVLMVGGHHGLPQGEKYHVEGVARAQALAAPHFHHFKSLVSKILEPAISVGPPLHFHLITGVQVVALHYFLA